MKLALLSLYFASLSITFCVMLNRWGKTFFTAMQNSSRSFQKKLEKEFIQVSKIKIVATFAGVAALSAALCAFTKNGAAIIVLPLICTAALLSFFSLHALRRRKKIVSQVPFFLDLLESHVKAGISLPQALQEITAKVKSPLREEIKIITGNLGIGLRLDEALRSLYERSPSEETLITYLSISNCLSSGANISEMVSKVKRSLIDKQRAEKKMKAQTAQAKLQGIVLTFVPLFLIFSLETVVPGYLQMLISAPAGKLILTVVCVLLAVGWLMILRIIRPEV